MPKYRVEILETVCHTVYLDVENADVALDNAYEAVDERLVDLYSTEWLGTYDSEIFEITDEDFNNA